MYNRIYKIPITLDESKLFGENKLYVGLTTGKRYTYEQLVQAYKATDYVSIDDFIYDNEIVSSSTLLYDGDYGYCDISYVCMPDGSLILIVAICN